MLDLFNCINGWIFIATLWRVVTESNEIKDIEKQLKTSFANNARKDLAAGKLEKLETHLVELANSRLLPSFTDGLSDDDQQQWFDDIFTRKNKEDKLKKWAGQDNRFWTSISPAEQTELVERVANSKLVLYRRTVNDSETAMVLSQLVGRELKQKPPYSLSELAEDVRFTEELDDSIERKRPKDGEIHSTRGRVQRIVARLVEYKIVSIKKKEVKGKVEGHPYAVEATPLLIELAKKYFQPEMDKKITDLGHAGSK